MLTLISYSVCNLTAKHGAEMLVNYCSVVVYLSVCLICVSLTSARRELNQQVQVHANGEHINIQLSVRSFVHSLVCLFVSELVLPIKQ